MPASWCRADVDEHVLDLVRRLHAAKVVATSAAITHYNFMGQNAAIPVNDTDLAVMFIAAQYAGRQDHLPQLL